MEILTYFLLIYLFFLSADKCCGRAINYLDCNIIARFVLGVGPDAHLIVRGASAEFLVRS